MSLHDLRNDTTNFDLTVTYDDFLHQILSGHQPSGTWPDIPAADGLNADHFNDQSAFLSSKLRQQQITAAAGDRFASFALKSLQLPRGLASAGESAFFQNGNIDDSSFKSPIGELDNTSFQNLFHGFSGCQTSNQTQQFQNLSTQKNVVSGNATAGLSGGGGAPSQPRQRVRARRGQATDPHSIAERIRRERIADRMKALQEIVPKANKSDKATMLDDIIDYVKFLQLQVKVLSMSRMGGAAGATIAVKGGDDFEQQCGGVGQSINESSPSLNNHTTTEMEKQVVKMMEDDMGSAMQYLQGKGLCLMPISLATTISATKFHPSGSRIRLDGYGGGEGGGPSSPNMSVLTVQSRNGVALNDSP